MQGVESISNNEFAQIRTLLVDGELWFYGEDVIKAIRCQTCSEPIIKQAKALTRKKRRVVSKIDFLPRGLKNEVINMIYDSKKTYSEISTYIEEAGYQISRSAVGRYAKQLYERAEKKGM